MDPNSDRDSEPQIVCAIGSATRIWILTSVPDPHGFALIWLSWIQIQIRIVNTDLDPDQKP
jgi:hypothetical protein